MTSTIARAFYGFIGAVCIWIAIICAVHP